MSTITTEALPAYPEGHLREEWECGKRSVAAAHALGATGVRHMPWQEFVAWMNTDNSSD